MQHPSQPPLSTGTSQLATTRDLGSRFAGCDPLVPDHLVTTCPRARRDERPVFQTGSLAGASPAVGAILTTSADCKQQRAFSHTEEDGVRFLGGRLFFPRPPVAQQQSTRLITERRWSITTLEEISLLSVFSHASVVLTVLSTPDF